MSALGGTQEDGSLVVIHRLKAGIAIFGTSRRLLEDEFGEAKLVNPRDGGGFAFFKADVESGKDLSRFNLTHIRGSGRSAYRWARSNWDGIEVDPELVHLEQKFQAERDLLSRLKAIVKRNNGCLIELEGGFLAKGPNDPRYGSEGLKVSLEDSDPIRRIRDYMKS